MRRPMHYILRLSNENPVRPQEDEVFDEEGSHEDPSLRARKLEDGTWAFFMGSEMGFRLLPANAGGDGVEEAYLPCSVVEYLMSEHIFGQMFLGADDIPLDKSACRSRAQIDLGNLGYAPTNKSL